MFLVNQEHQRVQGKLPSVPTREPPQDHMTTGRPLAALSIILKEGGRGAMKLLERGLRCGKQKSCKLEVEP